MRTCAPAGTRVSTYTYTHTHGYTGIHPHIYREPHTNALGIVNTPRESKDYFWRRDPTKQKEFTMSEFCVRRQSCNRKSKTLVPLPSPSLPQSLKNLAHFFARHQLRLGAFRPRNGRSLGWRKHDETDQTPRTRVLDTSGRLRCDPEGLALSHWTERKSGSLFFWVSSEQARYRSDAETSQT